MITRMLCGAAILSCLFVTTVEAQTWDGGGAQGGVVTWSTGTNWSPDGPLANNGTANIIMAGTIDTANTVSPSFDINSLTFNNTAGAFFISGSQLTIRAGGVTNNSTIPQQISLPIVLGTAQTWNAASGPLTISGGQITNGGNLLTISGSSNTVLNSSISGTGGLAETGTGTLTLGGGNAFTGGVTINAGTLQVGNVGALNSTTPNAVTFGAGSTGTLTLKGNSVTVSGLSTNATVGTPVVQNANAVAATLTIDNASGSTYASVLQDGAGGGALSLTKTGAGTLTLNGSNQYTGVTTVSTGTLLLGNANALGSTAGGTTIASGATLDLGGQAIGAENLNIQGTGVGGNGALINSSGTAASLSGTIESVAAGTLTVGGTGDITLSGNFNPLFNSSVLTKNGANVLNLTGTVDNYALAALVNSGIVNLAKTSAAFDGSTEVHAVGTFLTVAGGTAELGGTGGDQIYDYAPVTVTSGAFDTNGRSETIHSLALQGTGIGFNGALVNSANGSSILTVTDGVGGGITLTGNMYIGVPQSGASLTLNGRITGNFALTKYGDGTLILNGNSDFTGGVYLNLGPLAVGSDTALGTGTLTFHYGTIQSDTVPRTVSNAVLLVTTGGVTGSTDLTLSGPISGSGYLSKGGSGTLTLSGANNFTGGLNLAGPGTLAVGSDTALGPGTLTFFGGAIRSETVPRTVSNVVNLDASGGIVTGSLDLTLTGPISGAGALTKKGSGTLMLTGVNSFTGGVTVVAGTVVQSGGTLPGVVTNQASFVYNSGTFSGQLVNQGSATFNANFTAGNGLVNHTSIAAGTGLTLTLNGSGLDNEGIATLAGGTIAGAGPLVNNALVSGTGTLGGSGGFTNNAQLSISSGNMTVSNSGANANAGNIDIPAGLQLRLTGGNLANTGTVNVNGGIVTGTATFNNNTGGTISGHGTISSPFGSNAGSLDVESGTLNIPQGFASSGEIYLGGGLATLSGAGAITNTGLMRGDGVVTKAVNNNAGGEIRAENGKRLKLQGVSGASAGKINLQGGTAEFSQPLTNSTGGQIEGRGTLITGGAGLTNNGHIALSSGITDVFGDVNNSTGSATKGITISGNADVTFWDDVTNGAGSLFKLSSGSSVTVFGTYSGAGISGSANDIHLESDVSPGFSPATVDFGGNLHFSSTTTLKIELGGTLAGTEYDQVHVSEQLSLDGTLQVSLINAPFTPAAGNSFDILDWGTLSGTFSSLNLPAIGAGLMWNASQLYTAGILSVTLAGDYNHNGIVDAADYTVWRDSLGRTGTGLAANGDNSGTSAGKIDQADYTVWKTNFGAVSPGIGSGSGAGVTAAVPEPKSVFLLLVAGVLLAFTRPR